MRIEDDEEIEELFLFYTTWMLDAVVTFAKND